MKLTFQLRFHTEYGQSLLLSGNRKELGDGEPDKAVPLEYLNPEFWQATVRLPQDVPANAPIRYHYALRNADGSFVEDWGHGDVIDSAVLEKQEVLIVDSWNHAGYVENAFYTAPFKQVFLKPPHAGLQSPAPPALSGPGGAGATHTFKVKAPLLAGGQTLCLLGQGAAFGNWNTDNPLLLRRLDGGDFFGARLDLSAGSFPLAYKYGVYDVEKKAFIRYEGGRNRTLHNTLAPRRHTIVNDGFVALPANTWKGAGVAIPVFSLRSENSFGIGEFADLKPLADWGSQAGLKLIQILPVNDTTATHSWMDSYPYNTISAFALHPIYLNLERLAAGPNKLLLARLEPERTRLNALDTVDYEAVLKAKLGFIKQIFPSQKRQTFESGDYQRFFAANRRWLAPYAAFCHLRDTHGTSDFNRWPACSQFRAEEIDRLASENFAAADDIGLSCFIQYHLHLQLKEAAEYLHSRGLILKGDVPIGVSRCGADAWEQPGLYHLDFQTGAPPDAFATKGQNWGFPTYNWPRMKQDGFAWWKRRFEQMSGYFDAFRVDHILGFFRIWSIPSHAVEGILGRFAPAIPVGLDEFDQRGIEFDRDRFTRPYITDPVLKDVFGRDHATVKREYLVVDPSGRYSLKPGFATQRQVERHFAALKESRRNARIRAGLYELIANVIVFEDEDAPGRHFHFRFDMEKTSSFRNLPPAGQSQLKELYEDYFYRRQDDCWMKEAMQKLPALKRVTNMLVCGEDLGLVPRCVPEVMRQLGLLSLEIQRMPKEFGRAFSRPQEAPYLSVVMPSTHDMSTVRAWWEEDRGRSQDFFNHELGRTGPAPRRCEAWINRAIVLQHLQSPAIWSLFQLPDLLGMDETLRRRDPAAERINVPGDANNRWHYRMHLTLEQLQQATRFNQDLRECLRLAGRC